MNGETFEVFKELQKNGRIQLQRIYNLQGELLFHCARYGGSGQSFTTERELYAYCEGRGWFKRSENPYYARNCGINLMYDYYPIVKEENFDYADNAKLQIITFKVSERISFDLYCCLYRGKRQYYETKAEVYAYCQGKKIINGSENYFINPHLRQKA